MNIFLNFSIEMNKVLLILSYIEMIQMLLYVFMFTTLSVK